MNNTLAATKSFKVPTDPRILSILSIEGPLFCSCPEPSTGFSGIFGGLNLLNNGMSLVGVSVSILFEMIIEGEFNTFISGGVS